MLSALPSKVLKSFIGLEEPEPIVRSTPTVSKYRPRSNIDQLVTMRRPVLTTSQSMNDPNSTITMPCNSSATCVSRASMCSVTENLQYKSPPLQVKKTYSDMGLMRRGAMRKPYSPWRTTIEIDDATAVQKEHTPLRRASSVDILQGSSLSAYNPDKPLMNFPLKKSQMSHLARARSIKTTIGPLTKEVCEQLNILVESDNDNKVVATCICV